MSRLAVFAACLLATGCTVSRPASWSVAVDQVRTGPAAPTADTPVVVEFRVTCPADRGERNRPVQIKVAASLVGELKVYTEVVVCSVGYSAQEGVTFVGLGRIELGKLRPGRHQVELH